MTSPRHLADFLRAVARVLRALAWSPPPVRSAPLPRRARAPRERKPRNPTAIEAEAPFVERLKAKDPAAFAELVERHGPRVLALARRYLHDEHRAADAVQDVWVAVVRWIGGFRGTSQLSTWLHRMTFNAAMMILRKRSRRPEVEYDGEAHADASQASSAVDDERPDDLVMDAESVERVRALVPEGSILDLASRGIHLREIAARTGMGISTVKSRLRRQRTDLLARLRGVEGL